MAKPVATSQNDLKNQAACGVFLDTFLLRNAPGGRLFSHLFSESFLEGVFSMPWQHRGHFGAHFGGILGYPGLLRKYAFVGVEHHSATFRPSHFSIIFGPCFWKASRWHFSAFRLPLGLPFGPKWRHFGSILRLRKRNAKNIEKVSF